MGRRRTSSLLASQDSWRTWVGGSASDGYRQHWAGVWGEGAVQTLKWMRPDQTTMPSLAIHGRLLEDRGPVNLNSDLIDYLMQSSYNFVQQVLSSFY